jgi:hypothetical protein
MDYLEFLSSLYYKKSGGGGGGRHDVAPISVNPFENGNKIFSDGNR